MTERNDPAAVASRRAIASHRAHALIGAVAVLAIVLAACGSDRAGDAGSSADAPGLSGVRYLAADPGTDNGFARAAGSRNFSFPADHGTHADYRTEWWYFTGNVFDADNRHYGFELTLFRLALAPGAADVWMGNLAITDSERERFQAAERLSRGAPGLAGLQTAATSSGERLLTLEDWSIRIAGDAATLSAAEADFGIEFVLSGLDRIVLQGDGGLDRKGPESGNASWYYSAPRLAVSGELRSAGKPAVAVTGSAWLDREWSTSALSPGVAGWDWFALQLDDGSDLMFYRLRNADGSTSPFSGGSLTAPDGHSVRLTAESVTATATRDWTSKRTSVRYPVAWDLSVPDQDLELSIRPRLDDQEIDLSVRYWEGAVTVSGNRAGQPIGGVGYLELAGY